MPGTRVKEAEKPGGSATGGALPRAPGRVRRAIGAIAGRADRGTVRIGVLYGVAYGAAMVLAFPGFALWGFVLVMGAAMMLAVVRGVNHPGSVAIGVAIGTLPAWAFEHAWIINVSEMGYPFLVMYSGAGTGLMALIAARIVRRWRWLPLGIVGAIACCGAEVARGEVILGGYPWHLIAHPLVDVPAMASAGAVVGAYGLSALVCAIAGGVVDAVARRRVRTGVATCAFAAMLWAGLAVVPGPREDGEVRVAVVQTDNPQDNRTPATPWELIEQMQSIERSTREAAARRPDLIVWPESMMPGRTMDPASIEVEKRERVYWKVRPPEGEMFTLDVYEFAMRTMELQRELGIPMLVGSESFENLRITMPPGGGVEYVGDRIHNSVFLVVDGRVAETRYDKMFLTPFGEVMPGIRHWPWLQRQVQALGAYGMPFDLSPGREGVVIRVPRDDERPAVRVMTPICFEATMPNVCRRLAYRGGERRVDLIVNGTNDGWFNFSRYGRAQHLQIARWRCVELGAPMARAANTGISALVDHRGRMVERLESGNGVLSADLPIMEGRTAYAAGGWMVPWWIGGLGWLMLACTWVRAMVGGPGQGTGSKGSGRDRGKDAAR